MLLQSWKSNRVKSNIGKITMVAIIFSLTVYLRIDIHLHLYLPISDILAPSLNFPVLITAMWYLMSTSYRNPQLLKKSWEDFMKVAIRKSQNNLRNLPNYLNSKWWGKQNYQPKKILKYNLHRKISFLHRKKFVYFAS